MIYSVHGTVIVSSVLMDSSNGDRITVCRPSTCSMSADVSWLCPVFLPGAICFSTVLDLVFLTVPCNYDVVAELHCEM